MVMPYHLHMPSYFLETFTEYPSQKHFSKSPNNSPDRPPSRPTDMNQNTIKKEHCNKLQYSLLSNIL